MVDEVNLDDLPPTVISDKLMVINKTGGWRSLRPVIDKVKCTSCMICWKFCPDACVIINDGKPEIDLDYCKGCGICAQECSKKAITLVVEKK